MATFADEPNRSPSLERGYPVMRDYASEDRPSKPRTLDGSHFHASSSPSSRTITIRSGLPRCTYRIAFVKYAFSSQKLLTCSADHPDASARAARVLSNHSSLSELISVFASN